LPPVFVSIINFKQCHTPKTSPVSGCPSSTRACSNKPNTSQQLTKLRHTRARSNKFNTSQQPRVLRAGGNLQAGMIRSSVHPLGWCRKKCLGRTGEDPRSTGAHTHAQTHTHKHTHTHAQTHTHTQPGNTCSHNLY
jgi:hypothetical protein